MNDFIFKLSDDDNVALARRTLKKGEAGVLSIIPSGHKIASEEINEGEAIIKYGQPIGYAKHAIRTGEHLHTHNVVYQDVDRTYSFSTRLNKPFSSIAKSDFFGFKRSDGRVGTRNTIAI